MHGLKVHNVDDARIKTIEKMENDVRYLQEEAEHAPRERQMRILFNIHYIERKISRLRFGANA
jgi:hypothetical protein